MIEPKPEAAPMSEPQKKTRAKFSKVERRLLLLTGVCGVLLLGAPLWWRAQSRDPVLTIPTPVMPSPNAFDYYVRAGNAVTESNAIGYALMSPRPASQLPKPTADFSPPPGVPNNAGPPPVNPNRNYSPEEKAALVEANAGALQTLRQGFAFPYLHPPARSYAVLFPHYAKFRGMARLLALEAQVKATRGDWNGAAQSGLDGVRMGTDIPRGAGLIGGLVGIASEAIVRRELWKTVERLDAAGARAAARRLESIIARRVSYAETMQEEKWTGQASLLEILRSPTWRRDLMGLTGGNSVKNWPAKLRLGLSSKQTILDNYTRGMDAAIANARLPYAAPKTAPVIPSGSVNQILLSYSSRSHWNFARNETQNALLLTALALRAYRLERGSYPPSLGALAPAYLKQVPTDPFALKGALGYRRTGAKYSLYSVGPDSKDDGGKAIEDTRRSNSNRKYVTQPDSRGDVVAGINQ